jgi:hypothetical protein
MRKISRTEEQESSLNYRTAMEKEAIDLNVVHDVAQAVPHVMHGIGQAINWAKDTIKRPARDVTNYANDVRSTANDIAEKKNNFTSHGPTGADIGQAQNDVAVTDAGHAISAIGVGAGGAAGIAKGVGVAVNNAIDAFGDKKQVKNKDKFLRNHPIIDKLSSFKDRYANEKTANKYIEKQGDKWVILQKGTGKVLSHHDSKEKAEASFRAMEMHKHSNTALDPNDWRNKYFNLDADW